MYQILINNNIVKEYPFKLQCITWCILNGYVCNGGMMHWLIPTVKIKKIVD